MPFFVVIIPGPPPGSSGGYWVEGGPFATRAEAEQWRQEMVLSFPRLETYPGDQGGALEAPIVAAVDKQAAILAVCPTCLKKPPTPGERDLDIYVERDAWERNQAEWSALDGGRS